MIIRINYARYDQKCVVCWNSSCSLLDHDFIIKFILSSQIVFKLNKACGISIFHWQSWYWQHLIPLMRCPREAKKCTETHFSWWTSCITFADVADSDDIRFLTDKELCWFQLHIDRLMQERRNSIANAQELRLSCTNSSMWFAFSVFHHSL